MSHAEKAWLILLVFGMIFPLDSTLGIWCRLCNKGVRESMALMTELLKKRFLIVFVAVCSSGLTAAATLWWNAQLSGIINAVSVGESLSSQVITLALVTMLIMGATAYLKSWISGFACESMTHDLRMGYARHFSALPAAVTEALNAGEQLSRLQNEISDVSGYLNANLFQLIDDGIRFTATLVWLILLEPALTLYTNLPVLIILLYVVWSSKTIGAAAVGSQQAKEKMNGYADSLLNLFPIIRLYDAGQILFQGYLGALGVWEAQTVRLERTKARLLSLSGLLSSIPLMLLFLTGGHMVIQGTITVGTLYIFLNLSGNVSGVLMNMPGYIASFRQFTANMKRLSPNILLDDIIR